MHITSWTSTSPLHYREYGKVNIAINEIAITEHDSMKCCKNDYVDVLNFKYKFYLGITLESSP